VSCTGHVFKNARTTIGREPEGVCTPLAREHRNSVPANVDLDKRRPEYAREEARGAIVYRRESG